MAGSDAEEVRRPRPPHRAVRQGRGVGSGGVADPINFGLNACAGLTAAEMKPWRAYAELRPGGSDPAARLVEMDTDGVDAEILYPTPRLNWGVVANPDPEFHLALVQGYNDWLSEYVEYAP